MKMHRSVVLSLACLGLGTLSCQFMTDPASRGSDATSVAGASGHQPASGEGEGVAEEGESLANRDVIGAQRSDILAMLRDRHTVLSDRELVALASTIVEESTRHDLDPGLVMAVIKVESGGHHLAVSPVGAMGLMQLLPSTAEEVAGKHEIEWRGAVSLFDPFLNVKLGTAYLRELTDRYGDVTTALAAYNWGPGRIDRRLRRGDAVPSRYVRLVMKAYDAAEGTTARRS